MLMLVQEEAVPPYDFFFNIVSGNFGLTIVLLAICWRCLRRFEADLDRGHERQDASHDS